jgi:hypothetical protein
MKKNLLLGFLILFVLNTAAFAGLSDPKKESEKPAINDPKENKLSDEEISRLSRRAEIDNLYNSSLSNKEKNDSKNNLKPPAQENHHTRFYVGAGVLILIIVLILVLV